MPYKSTKYNTAATLIFPMVKKGTGDFAVSADWTPAVGDCKLSLNAGAGANTTNLPVALTSIGLWKLDLTAAELTSQVTGVVIADVTVPKAVEDNCLLLETYGNASAAIIRDLGALEQQSDVAKWLGTAPATPATAGVVEVHEVNPSGWKKNTAVNNWMFFLADSTTGDPKLAATAAVQRSIDGAAFANATNTPATEISAGWYKINLSAADLNGDRIAIKVTASGAKQVNLYVEMEP